MQAIANACKVEHLEIAQLPDSKSLWRITENKTVANDLIRYYSLKPADEFHPKFDELIQLFPDNWEILDQTSANVYTSSGYGVEHQESTDLLLVVEDIVGNQTFVLSEWIF